jgi:polar amino acid transport system permease protein
LHDHRAFALRLYLAGFCAIANFCPSAYDVISLFPWTRSYVNYTFQFGPVFDAWPLLLKGTWITIQLSSLAMLFGLGLAVICAWGKTSGPAPVRWIVNAYIELIRNTPFLVQLFFFYFALPAAGVRWSSHTAALVAMVVNLGAYAAEIVRAGIQSIPRQQIEAGLALNLSRIEIFRFIVLKPALRAIYPALASQFILLMLASSVVSVISADDLTSVAATLVSQTFRSFEIYIVITVIYFVLTLVFTYLFRLVFRLGLNYPDGR